MALLAFCIAVALGIVATGMLAASTIIRRKRREERYDLLYSLRWGDVTTNNYGFAPAESSDPERFQLQLYTELVKLLDAPAGARGVERVLEISCGRGGGLRHVASHLPGAKQVIGLDFSMRALSFCRAHYSALAKVGFVRGHALRLPFPDNSFDLLINVEASHAYGGDVAFLQEAKRVLRPRGRLLYADHRRRRKVPRLERQVSAAGFCGPLHDVTPNVVRACELDSGRRRRLIRSGLPWWGRPLGVAPLKRYAGIPGSEAYERLRNRDRMYFIACLTATPEELGEQADRPVSRAA